MTESTDASDRHPADLVAERVLAVPSVVSLDGGRVRQVATYLPGRRVVGVAWREDACEVSVVVRLSDRPLPEVAEHVRQAVAPVAEGRAVHVLISDVLTPDDQPTAAETPVAFSLEPASSGRSQE